MHGMPAIPQCPHPSSHLHLLKVSHPAASLSPRRISISLALAQSTKLAVIEERVSNIAAVTRPLPTTLAAEGKVRMCATILSTCTSNSTHTLCTRRPPPCVVDTTAQRIALTLALNPCPPPFPSQAPYLRC
jgi:hypothetical protein